ncbi:histone-lysine N-methyltransferase 2B-like [Ornithodoros turicata]|uniref:histone-lysine N-methyltransferase 2B-like n=1 Tax=Ornithodoros turicata TaxID=34597 RepID=UPI003139C3CC
MMACPKALLPEYAGLAPGLPLCQPPAFGLHASAFSPIGPASYAYLPTYSPTSKYDVFQVPGGTLVVPRENTTQTQLVYSSMPQYALLSTPPLTPFTLPEASLLSPGVAGPSLGILGSLMGAPRTDTSFATTYATLPDLGPTYLPSTFPEPPMLPTCAQSQCVQQPSFGGGLLTEGQGAFGAFEPPEKPAFARPGLPAPQPLLPCIRPQLSPDRPLCGDLQVQPSPSHRDLSVQPCPELAAQPVQSHLELAIQPAQPRDLQPHHRELPIQPVPHHRKPPTLSSQNEPVPKYLHHLQPKPSEPDLPAHPLQQQQLPGMESRPASPVASQEPLETPQWNVRDIPIDSSAFQNSQGSLAKLEKLSMERPCKNWLPKEKELRTADVVRCTPLTRDVYAFDSDEESGGGALRLKLVKRHEDRTARYCYGGSARTQPFRRRASYDMFDFLASVHRPAPTFQGGSEEDCNEEAVRRRAPQDKELATIMSFQALKLTARSTVGVYRSLIHGRGLYSKRDIDAGEMVIEYAGEVIRSVLTDKRERLYESRGIGCYMFRMDEDEVVDATTRGNAARFINHSCDPNCYSKVIAIFGQKHIVIFALRKIYKGEELTYDYKFPKEDVKIPCSCGARRCRKFLN